LANRGRADAGGLKQVAGVGHGQTQRQPRIIPCKCKEHGGVGMVLCRADLCSAVGVAVFCGPQGGAKSASASAAGSTHGVRLRWGGQG
jgi:hypothetical protein